MPRGGPRRDLEDEIDALLGDEEEDLPSPPKTPSPQSRRRKSAARASARSSRPGPAGDAADDDASSSSDDEPGDLRLRDDVGPDGRDEEGGQYIEGIYVPPPARPALTFECTGPRLVISHIESVNFKSYAGYHRLGPFHQSFTSIVGPNGSGKSNVIDSMLFVFGVRAQKIRSKKVGVLIHKSDGTAYEHCTVTVHFEEVIDKPDGDCDVVPGSQFRVSRTAFRTNESHYELNGKRSSLKEVGRFLRERKIDLDHNRFLILQGEVEQIAMMKPKALNEHDCGLLEFLEDVIGTVRYKVPLELLGKKLEEVEQERDEHMNRVKLTEKDLRQLDEPRQKALGYLRLMNELALTQNSIYQYRVRDYSEKLETLEKEKVAIEGEKSEIVQQINVFEEEKKVFDTEAKEVEKALADHTKRDDKAREKFNRVEKRDLELVAEGKRKADLRSKRKKEVKNLEAEIQTWARKPEENEREIAKLEKSLGGSDKEIETKKAELDAVMQTLDQETKRFQDEKDEYEEELSTLRKKYNEVKASMDMAQKNLDVYLSEETREKAKAVQIKTDLDNQRASLERKLEQLGELETEVREKVARRGPLQKELETLEKEELRLSHEVRRIHEQLTEKKNEFKNSAFRGRVIEGLMKEKKAGRIPGIFGRLGDLAAIDAKYDVAISTACPQLEHILVDSVDTGSECIRYLKANNLPRTSFVALDKQDKNAREMTIPKRFPENSLRLFDLIKVTDQRVLPAFYFVLRDALVVENLDLATRVAFDKSQRYKVVTINGDLIEVSGTMTGGGNQKICGKMGSKVVTRSEVGADNAEKETERVMEKLQTEGDQLRQQLNAVRDQKHQLQQEQDLLLRRLSELDRTVKMLTLDVNNLKVSVPALEARAVEQEKRLQQVVVDAGVVEQRQAEIDQRKKEFEEAKASVGVVQKKVDDLDAKMKKATSGKANTARDALKQAENKKKNIAKEISRLKVEVMTAGKKVENSKKRIEELTAEMEELAQAIEDVKATRASNEQDGKNAIAELDELKKDREELLGKKKEIDKKVAEVTNREGNVRSKLITIEQKLKEKVGEVKAIAPKVVDCKNHLAGLKLEPIDDEAMPTELPVLTEEELDALDVNGLKGEVHKLEQSLAKDKPNLAILEEYKEKQMAYIKRVDEFELVMLRRKKVREGVDLMKMRRSQEFIQGFTTISNKLKELYRIITLGGDAELELVDSMDPFSEGVHFTVRPPKKSWKNIINLSGGEKTLSSLALVFALHYYRPTPFYVMDEIDAALDFKNVSIVGRYIKERTKNAQFIIISLRSQMFELANRMVGIFKVRNVTGSLTIEPEMVFYSALALRRLPNDDRDLITARRAAVDVLRKEKIRRLENAVREKAEEEQMEREEQEEEQVDKMSRLLVTSISLCQLSPDTPAASQGEQLIKCVDEESVRYGLERDLVEAFKKALRDGLPQELWTAAMLFRKKMKMEEMDPEARLAMLRKRMRATSQGPAGLDDTNRSGFGDDSVAVARGLDAEEEEEEAGIKPLLDFVQRVIREANEEKAKAKMATATAAVNANRPGTQKGPTATAAAATDGTSKKDKAMKKVESLSKNTMMARKPVSEVAAKGTAAGVVPADEPQPSRGAKRKSATASDEDMSNGVAPARRSRSSRQIEK